MQTISLLRMMSVVGVLTISVFSVCAEAPIEKKMREDFSRAYKQIDQLAKDKNVSGLINIADQISTDWKKRSMTYYGDLMLRLCQVLRSDLSQDDIPFDKIYDVARQALNTYDPRKEDNISIEAHYWLLVHLQEHPTYPKGTMTDDEWAAKRKTEAEGWMIVWDRMETAIDPKWDPDEVFSRKAMPPAKTHLPPGVSPDAIEDPALRAEYEKAIEANNRKIKYHNEQRQLRKLKKQFTRSLTLYFGGTYSVAPYNDGELETLLSRHIKDSDIRSAILKAVGENKPKEETAGA